MLLNKIPVLDKGYVALLDSTCPTKLYRSVVDEFFGATDTPQLAKICNAVLVIKAPIFVQLHLAQHGLTMVNTVKNDNDAYVPSLGDIGAAELQLGRDIQDDMQRTTDALLINPESYREDGANKFVSQILMPVSTYTTFIVSGSVETWKKFYKNNSIPGPIKAYAEVVASIIQSEWHYG